MPPCIINLYVHKDDVLVCVKALWFLYRCLYCLIEFLQVVIAFEPSPTLFCSPISKVTRLCCVFIFVFI
jgi:hypothetical protein